MKFNIEIAYKHLYKLHMEYMVYELIVMKVAMVQIFEVALNKFNIERTYS